MFAKKKKKNTTEIEPVIQLMIAFGVCEQPWPDFCFSDCVHNKHVLCKGDWGGRDGTVQGESDLDEGLNE